MNKCKVLVTGGTGLVGSAIDLPNCVKVGSKDCDLKNENDLYRLFAYHQPTHVIHCAAKVGGVKANMDFGGDFFRENILINTNLIDCCRAFKIEKILNFASTCIFPDKVDYPLTVDQIFNGPPHESNAPYAYAKRMAMVQLKAYEKQYGLKSTTIIPCNIYGPNDNYDLNNSHVIPALIRKCWEAKRDSKDFVVWGSGKPVREFIFSEDVARYAEKALFEFEEEALIVSPGTERTIREVAELIAKHMNFEGNICFDDTKPDGQFRKPSNSVPCNEFRNDSFQTHSIDSGLKKTIDSFIASDSERNYIKVT